MGAIPKHSATALATAMRSDLCLSYPDGPFHTTFRWSEEKDTWQWLLEQKDKNGKWTIFADLKLSRVPK